MDDGQLFATKMSTESLNRRKSAVQAEFSVNWQREQFLEPEVWQGRVDVIGSACEKVPPLLASG